MRRTSSPWPPLRPLRRPRPASSRKPERTGHSRLLLVVLKPGATVKAGGGKAASRSRRSPWVRPRATAASGASRARVERLFDLPARGGRQAWPRTRASSSWSRPGHDRDSHPSGATWGTTASTSAPCRERDYTYKFTGAGVHAYIVDTGIRATHQSSPAGSARGVHRHQRRQRYQRLQWARHARGRYGGRNHPRSGEGVTFTRAACSAATGPARPPAS